MMSYQPRRGRNPSLLAFMGGLLSASSVGLSAYAAHAVADAHLQSNLQSAALFAFGNGIALAALSGNTTRGLGRVALYLILLGTLLFSGSLVLNAFFGIATGLAPIGGISMMCGWTLWAIDALRR